MSMTKRNAPPVKPPEPPADTSVRKPWQLRARNRPAATEWTWQDKSDFWAALGRAPKDPACLPPLTAHKGFFVAFRAQARAAMKMVRKFPSVLVLPLLVLALLVGLGIFGVRTAANDHVKSSRVDAEAAALKAANAYSLSLDAAILPVLTMGTFIRETPSMAALGPAFPRIAADLLKQARNSAALQLKLVPFGIVRAIVPPLLDLGTQGLNLFTDPTRRQEALQTVELKSVWMAGPLAVPPEERRVLIARNPVFMAGAAPDETWGNGAEGNTNCSACYDAATRTKFWGFAAVYIAFDDLTTGPNSPLLPLRNRNYLYRLTKPAAGESGQETILSVSSPAPPTGTEAVAVPVYLPGIPWLLEVYPEGGYRPPWEAPLIVVVVVVAVVISFMLFVAMVNHRRLIVLLRARLPGKALNQLQMGRPFYDYFPAVTVLDCSVVRYYSTAGTGGEPWAGPPGAGGAGTDPREVVTMLNDVYKSLDAIAERHGLHKVETYNDSYVCVGGCPEADGKDAITWACHVAHCARDMVVAAAKYRSASGQRLQLQIGLHSGPVSAAVIDGGKRLPRYCIFGGTVATAADLRATSQPQAIHVSRATAELLADAGDPMVMLVPRGLIRIGSIVAAGGAAAPGGAGVGAGAATSAGGLMYTSWLQVDLMAGAYGGAYGARAPSTDLVARHMDDDEISLDGLNIVRKALRNSEDGDAEEEDVDPEKQAAALGPLGFMHPFFGSFRRRVQPGDWEVVAAALGLASDGGDGDGAGGGGGGAGAGAGAGGAGATVTSGMVAATTAAAAAVAVAGVASARGRAELKPAAVQGKEEAEEEEDVDVEAAEVAVEVQLGRQPPEEGCAAGVAVAAARDQAVGTGGGKGGPDVSAQQPAAADDGAGGSVASCDGSSASGLGQRQRSSVPVSPATAAGSSASNSNAPAAADTLPTAPSSAASPSDAEAVGAETAAAAVTPMSELPSLPAPAPVTPTASGFDERASVLSALSGYTVSAALKGVEGLVPAAAAAATAGVAPGAAAPAALRDEGRQ